eukprot:TRINITY_DN9125_c0_g1_i1.p1 TRINITY_DN9125_c0_g1~~TRINITY_DN9125_c0_g1_i1.p1  ORF type:complete len:134 (-),score=35.52 TRINITY_DN9125_c0_g1_i1:105-506(-)
MRVFIVDKVDFLALGDSQNVFGACIADDTVSEVSKQYSSRDVTCSASTNCESREFNQLQDKIGTISASIGAAAGGSGCICGICVVALLFYRRKKVKLVDADFALSPSDQRQKTFSDNFMFDETPSNPLFQQEA